MAINIEGTNFPKKISFYLLIGTCLFLRNYWWPLQKFFIFKKDNIGTKNWFSLVRKMLYQVLRFLESFMKVRLFNYLFTFYITVANHFVIIFRWAAICDPCLYSMVCASSLRWKDHVLHHIFWHLQMS